MAQQLSPEQIARIEAVAEAMGQRGNLLCGSATKALSGKTYEQKRGIVAGIYGAAYELMLAFQMAMDATRSVDEIKQALAEKHK